MQHAAVSAFDDCERQLLELEALASIFDQEFVHGDQEAHALVAATHESCEDAETAFQWASGGATHRSPDIKEAPAQNNTGTTRGDAHTRELVDQSSVFSFVQILHSVGHYEKLEANQYFELIEDPLLAILKPAIVSILVSILKSILLSLFAQIVPPIIAMVMICPIQKFMFMGQPCTPEGARLDPDMPDMPDLPPIPGMPTGHGGPNSPGGRPMPTGDSRHEGAATDDVEGSGSSH